MTYYNDNKIQFILDGVQTLLTEEQAEVLEMSGHQIEPVWSMDNALPDGAANEYLDCTCPDDPPNGYARMCTYCRALVDEEPTLRDVYDEEGWYIGTKEPDGTFHPQDIGVSK